MTNRLSRHFAHLRMTFLSGLDTFYLEEPWLPVAKLFRIVFLGWLFLHTALLVPYAESIWGPAAYVANAPVDVHSPFQAVVRLLDREALTPYFRWFVAAQLASLVFGILGIKPRLMTAVAWVLTLNLDNRAAVTMDGGNNLAELLLFYMIFQNTTGERVEGRGRGLRTALQRSLSNGAFWLARLQVWAVYATVSVLKLNGSLWQRGMALYYILQSEQYSHPWVAQFVVAHPWVSVLGTYFTVIFQICFPFLVWQRRSRPFVLLAGTALHLGVAFVMGLFSFGTVMCVSYLLLFQREWSSAVLEWLSPRHRIVVGFDEACGRCQQFARLVSALDVRKLIVHDGARTPKSLALATLPREARLARIAVVDEPSGVVKWGYDGLCLILSRLPVAVPLMPVLYVVGYLGIGDRVYRSVARNAWRRRCVDGACGMSS